MRKTLLLLVLTLFSFSAIHADDNDFKWELSDDGTLIISGTGDMPVYNMGSNKAPWYDNRDYIRQVVIKDGVTNIGGYTFIDCRHILMVTIPNSVTSIGDWAFNRCEGLSSIIFKGSTPPEFVDDVFHKINNSIPVYVPANSIEAYKSVLGGWGLSDIKALPLIYLKDGEAYTQDSQIDGMEIYYTRKFSTNWEALYLPFSLKYEDWKDDFEIAYISSVRQKDNNDDGTIDETKLEFVKLKGGSTAPNTPYIIRAKSSGEKTLSVQNTTLYKAEKNSVECSTTTAKFTFTGTYKPISALQLITHGY